MKKVLILFAIVVAMASFASASFLGFFAVSPQGTFLEQSANDVCSEYNIPGCNMSPTFINLTALGVNPGDPLTITDVGVICVNGGVGCTQFPASSSYLGAMFASTNTISGPGNLNRVTGTIAPGAGATLIGINPNLNTLSGNIPTNIANDFYISTTVIVPAGATYLVVGTLDSAYADNSAPTNLWGVNLFDPNVNAPEPSTYALMFGGIGALLLMRRRSRLVQK